jgi:hypothetical protein
VRHLPRALRRLPAGGQVPGRRASGAGHVLARLPPPLHQQVAAVARNSGAELSNLQTGLELPRGGCTCAATRRLRSVNERLCWVQGGERGWRGGASAEDGLQLTAARAVREGFGERVEFFVLALEARA